MKKIIKTLTLLLLPLLLYSFALIRHQRRPLQKVEINYEGADNLYITNQDILNVMLGGKAPEQVPCQDISVTEMEARLNANPMLESAEVYLTVDGILKAQVKQRLPIARIWENKNAYYMDIQGEKMPLSEHYSARVPIISGKVTNQNWQGLYTIALYIYNDSFLKENVVQINATQPFSIKMRIAPFSVILGDDSQLKKKFDNLKAFYKKADKDNILDKYSTVNLQYSNQVICTRQE